MAKLAVAADVLAGMKTRWPMEEMLGADLVSAALRRAAAAGGSLPTTSGGEGGLHSQ